MKKRALSLAIIALVMCAVFLVGYFAVPMRQFAATEEEEKEIEYDKETVYLWYNDEALTNYLMSAAVEYNTSHDTRVMPTLVDSLDYLENINATSSKADVPDLYIVSHDMLSKAYMAGLAEPISLSAQEFDNLYISPSNFAVTYKDMLLGYPLNFETSILVYNESYLEQMAITALDQEAAAKAAEETIVDNSTPTPTPTPTPTVTPTPTPKATASAQGTASPTPYVTPTPTPTPSPTPEPTPCPYSEDEIGNKMGELLPLTMEDVRNLANNYDAPEGVETFMNWDVNDIFYNYFFIGDTINVGGEAGWDENSIDIYNVNAIESLEAYQQLNQFFSIDVAESNYSKVVQDFIDGKIIFTIATSDIVNTLETAREEGTFLYDYGVSMIPDMNSEIDTRSMSVTNCVAVSPFSKHQETAQDFAKFVTTDYAGHLYNMTGKISNCANVLYDHGAFDIFAMEFGYSAPLPKMLQTSNFWVQLEAVFAKVWEGEDANATLKELAEQVNYQITGERTELEKLEPVKEDEEEIEYFDEDELRREAMQEGGAEE